MANAQRPRGEMSLLRQFLVLESAAGLILFFAAVLAVVINNSPLEWLYDSLLRVPFEIRLGEFELAKPLLLWINDGLMAVFFLLVGLEIKRELLAGELSSRQKAILPMFAAVGGMVVPAGVFAALNWGEPTLRGWAIPAATDIAFALGVLAILGSRVPLSLKVFLTALAIMDDLGAIVIIALFYTENLSFTAMALGSGFIGVLVLMNRARVISRVPYMLVGVLLWVCVLKSGIHATLAGVLVAFSIPLSSPDRSHSPLEELEHSLHPWVAYLVLPVFAFANAGVSLTGLTLDDLLAPLPLGIALGLFVGKQVGVFVFTWIPVRMGLAVLPHNTSWVQIYGASLLAGIGFTMSLFIGTLALEGPDSARGVRVGVILGSLLAGLLGYLVLRFAPKRR